MRPHRRQPTRLCHPWDSPGKNTGVGCHFLLQCMKVKSESEVVQLCLTPSDPMDCSTPGPSVHGIFQARVLEWGAIAFSGFGYINDCNSSFLYACDFAKWLMVLHQEVKSIPTPWIWTGLVICFNKMHWTWWCTTSKLDVKKPFSFQSLWKLLTTMWNFPHHGGIRGFLNATWSSGHGDR